MLSENFKSLASVGLGLLIGLSLLIGCVQANVKAPDSALSSLVSDGGDEQTPEPEISSTAITMTALLLVVAGLATIAGVWYRRRIPPLESRYKCFVEPTAWEGETSKPLFQTLTTYILGDEYFDPSFTIKTETDAFLGEYGVGIVPFAAQGERMPAFELWLFDKHDPENTDSQMLISEDAHHDEMLREKLTSIGPLVLAQLNHVLALQTATLRVRARVAEMEYVRSEKFDKRFFKELTVELAAWQKN